MKIQLSKSAKSKGLRFPLNVGPLILEEPTAESFNHDASIVTCKASEVSRILFTFAKVAGAQSLDELVLLGGKEPISELLDGMGGHLGWYRGPIDAVPWVALCDPELITPSTLVSFALPEIGQFRNVYISRDDE